MQIGKNSLVHLYIPDRIAKASGFDRQRFGGCQGVYEDHSILMGNEVCVR